jgi:hypothetical protein
VVGVDRHVRLGEEDLQCRLSRQGIVCGPREQTRRKQHAFIDSWCAATRRDLQRSASNAQIDAPVLPVIERDRGGPRYSDSSAASLRWIPAA